MNTKIKFLLCGVIALAPTDLRPQTTDTRAEIDYIYDGDTFAAKVLLKNDMKISVRVRIMQIDAPEKDGKCESEINAAKAAKKRLEALLPVGDTVYLSKIKDDKYLGRIDAFVKTKDGADIGNIMVEEGHARPYDGKKRAGWCD